MDGPEEEASGPFMATENVHNAVAVAWLVEAMTAVAEVKTAAAVAAAEVAVAVAELHLVYIAIWKNWTVQIER